MRTFFLLGFGLLVGFMVVIAAEASGHHSGNLGPYALLVAVGLVVVGLWLVLSDN